MLHRDWQNKSWIWILWENVLHKGTQHHIMSHIWLRTENICVNMKDCIYSHIESTNIFQKHCIEILKNDSTRLTKIHHFRWNIKFINSEINKFWDRIWFVFYHISFNQFFWTLKRKLMLFRNYIYLSEKWI